MARPDPTLEPPGLASRPNSTTVTQVREYRLITPLFGGGVRPAEADPVTVVRASEVRGQLRFWWRAARGGRFNGSLQEMKAAEDRLWGAPARFDSQGKIAAGQSQVHVVVEPIDAGSDFVVRDPRSGRPLSAGAPQSPYSYGAFPLNDKQDATLRENVRFRLRITFPAEARADVEAALWTWETFGGIGARTRRGFGALVCELVDGKAPDRPPADRRGAAEWLRRSIAAHIEPGKNPPQVPQLTRDVQFVVTEPRDDADEVWRGRLLERLKAFRQQRPQNRIPQRGRIVSRPGRNRWPEQDEVRRLTGRRLLPRHREEIVGVRKFPRAAFGLPLIIQYKRDDQLAGDPLDNNTVNVDGKERFASPLILRPIACATGYVGLALVLENSRVPAQAMLTTRHGRFPIRTDLSEKEAQQIMRADNRTPLLNGETDVLRAFLNFLEER